MESMPENVFYIIFKHTTLPTILKCKEVCKTWNSAIKSFLLGLETFEQSNKFTDLDATILQRCFPNLKSLLITLGKDEKRKFTTDGFFKLWAVENLQHFEIDFSKKKFKNPKWFSFSALVLNFDLEVFKIANVDVEQNFLEELASRAPNIQELSLISIPNMSNITRGIQHMAAELRMLRTIVFKHLSSFEDFELNYMFPIPEFNRLDTFYAENTDFPNYFFKMFKAPTLRKVEFIFCHTVNDSDIEDLTKRCPNIENFKMNLKFECPHFTDSAIEALSLNLKDLRVVEFDCRGTTLSYRSIRFLIRNATKLEMVTFNNLEGFETTEEIEGFLEETSRLRHPHLTIGEFIFLF